MWITWASRFRISSWSASGWTLRKTTATCATSASWKGEKAPYLKPLFRWPQMNANERESLVKNVIGAAYEVANVLGAGFLEKVYERALVNELRARGIRAQTQVPFPVLYKGE